MHTARLLTLSQHALQGGVYLPGVYLLGGVVAQGVYLPGVYLPKGGCTCGGCTCPGRNFQVQKYYLASNLVCGR